jgi:hypothetical protein
MWVGVMGCGFFVRRRFKYTMVLLRVGLSC